MKAEAFLESYQGRGSGLWTDDRPPGPHSAMPCAFSGWTLYEARVYFSAEGLRRVEVSALQQGRCRHQGQDVLRCASDAVKA